MKNNLLKDAKIATNFFLDMRKERKNGNEVEVKKAVTVPYVQDGVGLRLYDTVEGSTLSRLDETTREAARTAFNKLSREEKFKFSSSPKDGEFVGRACFWKEMLKPVLTEKELHIAMRRIIKWHIHIKEKRKEKIA